MGDWIGLGLFVFVLLCGFLGLARLGAPPEPMTREEFERRAAEGRGWMSAGAMAGMHALQKLINPKAAEAVEVQRDLEAGFYNESFGQGGEGGAGSRRAEGDEPPARRKGLELSAGGDGEEDDA